MNGSDLTEKQLKAAEKYILLRRASMNDATPDDNALIELRWKEFVMLIAEYGAIRAGSIGNGGSVNEPGEVYLTGRVRTMKACPWCELEYDLTPYTEPDHLKVCPVFQSAPVAEVRADGKTFVRLPSDENILVQRVRIQ